MENIRTFLRDFRRKVGRNDEDQANLSRTPSAVYTDIPRFKDGNLVIQLQSFLLRDDFYIVSNRACLQHVDGDAVTYLPEELELICNLPKDSLKRIHDIKKSFGCRIIGKEKEFGGSN